MKITLSGMSNTSLFVNHKFCPPAYNFSLLPKGQGWGVGGENK